MSMPKKAKRKYSYNKVMAMYEELKNERSEWEAEWRTISNYLLPGRGIYQTYSKPQKRKLTSPRVINTIAEDSLYVLTSGMHGGLTSPSREWFRLGWADPRLDTVVPLKAWLQDSTSRLHAALQTSNFYSIINSFYIEYAGFGTGCVYVGEDADDAPFRFELLTAGEYAFSMSARGVPDVFFRSIFLTPRQLVEKFPKTASKEAKRIVKRNEAGADERYITIVEMIIREPFMDKPYYQVFYEIVGETPTAQVDRFRSTETPLSEAGFYEFPYPLARWNTIGSDVYGIGPGSRALPDIKRLQEMEKAFLMATHKTINPPLNAPARMKGKLDTLPGGYNYYSNPNEQVKEIYQVRFDYQGVSAAIERVEQRIQKNFFNDIFLSAARDPNASPYKATEVNAREQEKMLRLGPVIERLQHEFLRPLIERCFNIMLRKEQFAPLSPELADLAGDYEIELISPLATAQRMVAMQSVQSFLALIGQMAQFDQQVLDNVNPDATVQEWADITGVPIGIVRPEDEVKKLRAERAKQMQQQQQMQQQMLVQQQQAEVADTAKTQAEAQKTSLEAREKAMEMGMA